MNPNSTIMVSKVRNGESVVFRNEDGTLTEAGKKRYAKDWEKRAVAYYTKQDSNYNISPSFGKNEIRKSKGLKKKDIDNADNSFEDDIKKVAMSGNNVTADEKQRLSDLTSKIKDVRKKIGGRDYYDSDEYKKVEEDTFKEVLDYYKKEEPDYLNKLTQKYGSSDEFWRDHDFSLTLEGWLDNNHAVAADAYEKKYGLTELYDKEADLIYQKSQITSGIVNRLLGQYGSKVVRNTGSNSFMDGTLNEVVDTVLNSMDWDEIAMNRKKSS